MRVLQSEPPSQPKIRSIEPGATHSADDAGQGRVRVLQSEPPIRLELGATHPAPAIPEVVVVEDVNSRFVAPLGVFLYSIFHLHLNRHLDIEKEPLHSIGLVGGALAALSYWGAVVVRSVW